VEIQTGYFFITDITGYTQFLAQSELDHAKEILDALFESILVHIGPPLIVSNTQGDAIISYAPAHAFHQPQELLDVMEQTYFNFRRRLELMDINTTCDCNACVNMTSLDLKIFIHYGQYLVQQIGAKTDLQGTDVILAHLLMKNTVSRKFGLPGYGLLTETALNAMGVDPAKENMREHNEIYEHYGDVKVFIHDLHAAWEVERKRRRIEVTPDEAVAKAGVYVPIPPWIAWDYAANMDLKTRYYDLESIERTDEEGRREKIGSTFHCHHRLGDINYIYVDFDPPNYITFEGTAFGITSLTTLRIVPVEGGSRFEIYNGPPYGPFDEEIVPRQQKLNEASVATFAQVIAEEIEAGRIDPNEWESESALKADFRRPGVAKGRFGKMKTGHQH
jgi:hypothetical protein